MASGNRTIAVLGDMYELEMTYEAYSYWDLQLCRIDYIIAVGIMLKTSARVHFLWTLIKIVSLKVMKRQVNF